MKRKPIDVEELKKVFRLKDGKLERLNNNYKGGKWTVVVENKGTNSGYCNVRFNSRLVMYHTIVWVLTTGEDIPEEVQLDHINGDRLDNRIENLRLVSVRQNQQNQKVHREGQLAGCYFDKTRRKYLAQIWIGKKHIHLGYYTTEEEAHNIYVRACATEE